MIKVKGVVEVREGNADIQGIKGQLDKLPDGDYAVFALDNNQNRPLPQLKYLFGVVLKTISDKLPGNPPPDALYRYFEQKFAPEHTCHIQGESFTYYDLRNESSIEMNAVIEDIIHFAKRKWNIDIATKDDLMPPSAKGDYAEAYTSVWKKFIK